MPHIFKVRNGRLRERTCWLAFHAVTGLAGIWSMARRPAIMLYKGDWKRDPQLSACSPATRGIWIDLICDMDDLGRPTIKGTAAMIARTCRASEAEVIAALEELRESGAGTVTCDAGVFTVHCRRVEKDLHISSERTKAVQKRYKTSTNTPTKPLLNAEYENANESEYAIAVESVYLQYPRKIARHAALKAIRKAIDRIVRGELGESMTFVNAVSLLTLAVTAFARAPAGQAKKFTPHPATWFNDSRYMDDQKEWQNQGESNGTGKRHFEPGISQTTEEIPADVVAELREKIGASRGIPSRSSG